MAPSILPPFVDVYVSSCDESQLMIEPFFVMIDRGTFCLKRLKNSPLFYFICGRIKRLFKDDITQKKKMLVTSNLDELFTFGSLQMAKF